MMMDNDPMDNELKALLSDYAAPIPDDGFALRVKAEVAKRARLRRILIAGSGGLGAIIAALQVPALSNLARGLETPQLPQPLTSPAEPSMIGAITESLSFSSFSPMIMGISIAGLIVLWFAAEAALDAL